ncbi:MAG TPA: TIGR02391 family protein [Gemmatimonadales bacterium]|nr:TIGR02391 family protein [Gemmatimonadales bacterium]
MARSFSELFALVPNNKRNSKAKVVVALFVLGATDTATARATKDVTDLLKLHLKGGTPLNPSHTLTTAAPEVEPVLGQGGEKLWRVTPTGVTWLESLIGELLARGADPSFTYKMADLHPGIRRAAEELFLDGHYPEAVGRAAKWLNLTVRKMTGRLRDTGVPMMHQAFAVEPGKEARLVLGELREDWEKDRQDGLRSLFAGMQAAIMNVDKHGDLGIIDAATAMEHLAFLSYLAKQLERCRRVEP